MTAKPIGELLVQVADPALSEDALAEATSRLKDDLNQLESVDSIRSKPQRAPKGGKPVEPILLGALLMKMIASGGALTGIVSVVRSWIKGRANRTVTLQYGKDKLVIKGASSSEQERAVSEWISRHANQESSPLKSKRAAVLAKEQSAKQATSPSKPKKKVSQRKDVRHSS
jgi:hypothetical protein